METVEERATEYAERNFSQTDTSIQLAAGAGYQAGYKAGASIQRIIEQEVRLKKSEDVTQGEYDRQNSFFMGWCFKKRKEIPTYSDAIEWARKTTIDKACEWMKEQVYQEYGGGPLERLIPDTRIEEFRKAMEE